MESFFPNVSTAQSQLARDRVLDDLRNLVVDSETLLTATVGELSEQAGVARDRLKVGLARAKATLSELQEKGLASAKVAARHAVMGDEASLRPLR